MSLTLGGCTYSSELAPYSDPATIGNAVEYSI
jgi:hypothetical protein